MRRFAARYLWVTTAVLVSVGFATACASAPEEEAAVRDPGLLIQLRIVREEPTPEAEAVEFEGDTLFLERTPVFSDEDFVMVEPFVLPGELWVQLHLTPEAGARASSATPADIGSRLAVVVEGEVLYTVVNSGGLGPRAQLVVSSAEEDFDRIAALIRARWPGAP